MLKKTLCIAVLAAIVAAALYGIKNRSSYTDIVNTADFDDTIYVAQMVEDHAKLAYEREVELLPELPIIMRVEPVSDLEHDFLASCQRVVVKEVFKGTEIDPGDVIVLTSNWLVSVAGRPYSLESSYTNVMKPGRDYLVFSIGKADSAYKEKSGYYVFDHDGKRSIGGVFCYEQVKNVVSQNHYSDTTTYVPYREVRNNEFFGETEAALRAMESLKAEMLALYPIGSGRQ